MDRIDTAVFGATGMVGQRFISIIQDHPQLELVAAYASDRSAGRTIREIWKLPDIPLDEEMASVRIERLDVSDARKRGVKVCFSALPADLAKAVEAEAAESGLAVFSNAGAHRMDEDVPILIPEINSDHIGLVDLQRKNRSIDGFIVTNANCSVTGLSMALKPLIDSYSFKEVYVSTYQAISGAGYPGIPSLDINSNCVPYIKNEEDKMNREARKILGSFDGRGVVGRDVNVWPNCVRVPSRDGHLEAVTIPLNGEEPTVVEVSKIFSEFSGIPQKLKLPSAPERPIVVRVESDRPQPILDAMAGRPLRARGMAITIGRIRVNQNLLRFFCLVHNTVRGGAGDSVLNAEYAIHEGKV